MAEAKEAEKEVGVEDSEYEEHADDEDDEDGAGGDDGKRADGARREEQPCGLECACALAVPLQRGLLLPSR